MSFDLTATITTREDNPELIHAVDRFRKQLFVDIFRWNLPSASNLEERDQFDRDDTVYVALSRGDSLVGCFRAIRADRPYLTQTLFPDLATLERYPRSPDVWEISRFGVLPSAGIHTARANYSVMFSFARARGARALVALVDLTYERFLRRIGIATRRYGTPSVIGQDLDGRPIQAVAGEITLAAQGGPNFEALQRIARTLEINDETLVRGRLRLSA